MGKRLNAHLTKKQLNELSSKIELELSRVADEVIDESEILEKVQASDEVDKAIAEQEKSHNLRMRNRNVYYAKKLNQALEKFEEDEYGMCDDCGSPIRFERLNARPTAEMCIFCKEESERDETSNYTNKRSHSLGTALRV